MAFPTFDEENDAIHLNGGREIMLRLLWQAKFGDRFESEALLSPYLAELLRALSGDVDPACRNGSFFSPDDLFEIAKIIYNESWRSGWWSMSDDSKIEYLQNVAAPSEFSEKQMEIILDGVESLRSSHDRIRRAAEQASIP